MHAVVRLGSYISRGVYTVSAPFHPFGGAVDIIVVQQEDGSFKSSPWYVRFGKFQGVLKAKEKLVRVNVNGVDADFYMHLDHKGEAHFTREVDDPNEVDSLLYPSFSDGHSSNSNRPMKSKSCHLDSRTFPETVKQVSNVKVSRSSRIMSFVLGRKSVDGDRPPPPVEEDDNSGLLRRQSWDQSEIAADLLEVRWSTNLASPKHHKDNASRCSASDRSLLGKHEYVEVNDKQLDMVHSLNGLASRDEKMSDTSHFAFQKMETSDKGENDAAGVLKEEDGGYKHQIDFCDEIPQNINLESNNQQITVTPLFSSSIEEVNDHANTLQVEAKLLSEIVPPHETSLLVSQLSVIPREPEGPVVLDLLVSNKELYLHPVASTSIAIPGNGKATGDEFNRTVESLPNNQIQGNDMDVSIQHKHSLGRSLDTNTGSRIWQEMKEGGLDTVEADNIKLLHIDSMSDEDTSVHVSSEVGDPFKHVDPKSGNSGGWSFPFKRTSVKAAQSEQNPPIVCNDVESLQSSINVDEGKEPPSLEEKMKNKLRDPPSLEEKMKKKLRELTPTSEQLASLNLKEGPNTITFTFSTSMLGPQQLEARIFLWQWDTRIVISDVDGTITKSDVLGQFMPMVGIDWSQTGVTHLFTAIKENGYQLLFLSARSISQAHLTRQFLFNLIQDGKALPDGPIIISPDGLFPSLFREVIRRAPHEFKIACLEDIKALFPPDNSPFYAGFGNRETDEISYLKVGIPKGKIFIINPKGEVVVNRQIDTRSYSSLHELVHGMFPLVASSSEQEDFNSWNFWKLSPPVIDL